LTIDENTPVDLTIFRKSGHLIFQQQQTIVHKCGVDAFLDTPEKQLTMYSEKSDKNIFFRQITFLCLIFCSPLLCYLFLYFMTFLALFFVRLPAMRSTYSAIVCLILGIVLALPFYQIPTDIETKKTPEILRNLQSADWQDRVHALKVLSDKNLPIKQSDIIQKLIKSPLIPERYWLAKNLGNSHSAESDNMLVDLLKDPSPNVVCMALYSLGNKKRPMTSQKIIELIGASTHWYVQWYAYKSLKRLGWTQPE
jgi:HEAT repeat protein